MRSKIIQVLKKSESFVSGEDLSRTLNVSRAAVWKCVEELRAQGYVIEAVPRHGYRLTDVPDKLVAEEVQYKLGTKKFGCYVHHFETIASTMDEAFRLGMEGAPEGTVVVAETQTKGRGRMGRVWSSPKGKGLYFSILLRPQAPPAGVARLTLVTAVAVSEAIEVVTGLRPLIKWPNDLLLGSRKLAGILTELRAEIDKVEFIVVGMGINVNTLATQLPLEAVSLREAFRKVVPRVKLFQEILRSLENCYLAIKKEGYGPVFEEWKRRSATIGRKIRFEDKGRTVEGKAVDLADDGGLLVELASGIVVKRMAGDIVL